MTGVLNAGSRDGEILNLLAECKGLLETSSRHTKVDLSDQRILGHSNGHDKANDSYPDDEALTRERQARMTIAEWRLAKQWGGYQAKIALAITYYKTWVGETDEQQAVNEQHAWIAMVVRTPNTTGKKIIIWNSNWEYRCEEERQKKAAEQQEFKLRLQPPLVLHKQRDIALHWRGVGAVHSIWIGGSGNDGT